MAASLSILHAGDLVGGKYAITRVIGTGGMAIVYEAVHVRLGQRVALKMLLPELAERDDILTRFEREARAVAALRSPHVARVFDVDALSDGTIYLVMELLEGRDLAGELAATGPMPIAQAVDYVLQACDAMIEAHQQGTIHRDLKPSNLFLVTDGPRRTIKVLDFGVSKVALDAADLSVTSTRSALGTALYMSPEQVRSAKSVDARSDVWSLGVVLYELLTGRPPFDGDSATAVAAAIVADEPVPLRSLRADVPAPLEQVVMHAMEKDRGKRLGDVASLVAALAPFAPAFAMSDTLAVLAGRRHETAQAVAMSMVPKNDVRPRAEQQGAAAEPAGIALPTLVSEGNPVPIVQAPIVQAPIVQEPLRSVHSASALPVSHPTVRPGKPSGGRTVLWIASLGVLAAIAIVVGAAHRRSVAADLFARPEATGSTTILWNLASSAPGATSPVPPPASTPESVEAPPVVDPAPPALAPALASKPSGADASNNAIATTRSTKVARPTPAVVAPRPAPKATAEAAEHSAQRAPVPAPAASSSAAPSAPAKTPAKRNQNDLPDNPG